MAIGGGAAWNFRAPLADMWHTARGGMKFVLRKKSQPDPKTYTVLSKDLERWRKELAERYRQVKSPAERSAVEGDARVVLEQALPALMRWTSPGRMVELVPVESLCASSPSST